MFYWKHIYGGLGYADDAVLLAPTLSSMKDMLNICDAFGKKYNVFFNIEKYQFLHFPGSNGKSPAGLWHNDIYSAATRSVQTTRLSPTWDRCIIRCIGRH